MLWKTTLLGPLLLASFAIGQNASQHEFNAKRTLSIGYVLFPGFEPLDVYGPLEILYSMSASYKMSLALISFETGPVHARVPPFRLDPSGPIQDHGYLLGPATYATHTFQDAPALDIIIVPGGYGNVALEQQNNTEIEKFLQRRYDQADYVLSVCTGAQSLARAGLLKGKKATTNKSVWSYVTDPIHSLDDSIEWVPSARWVHDGKTWTSSGVSAGLDMMYAFLKFMYGTEKLDGTMNGIEYAPHQDPHWDPFAVVFSVPGADTSRPLADCVVPVGNHT
ncbi:class I glutamine amidotransferase-like protein [Melanomma pulvis-pyrius CBS 109.77]|uniref:Class I glutamine amidotransferase-like protein n=1 Tax=Melanomma pulvis-pyrius CBS 109.77 TaxID=1314802 RepID=A0A6A6WUW6_9PLEO|nr:class I glutamine amidotransferase-like protein [Melanomma pulvis-pyrius CBS 109.77]